MTFHAQVQRNIYAVAGAAIVFISQASSWSDKVTSVTPSDVGENGESEGFNNNNTKLRDADSSPVVDATESDDFRVEGANLRIEAANNSSFNTGESRGNQAFGK